MADQQMSIPEFRELAVAEAKRVGLPANILNQVLDVEVGGQLKTYLAQPDKYHYGVNEKGQRIAPHTGKVSTARGLFGIVNSTAKDPGWGVKPLQDYSVQEQTRFAADYLAALVRSSGGDLKKGLARYGEGEKYAAKVLGRTLAGDLTEADFQNLPPDYDGVPEFEGIGDAYFNGPGLRAGIFNETTNPRSVGEVANLEQALSSGNWTTPTPSSPPPSSPPPLDQVLPGPSTTSQLAALSDAFNPVRISRGDDPSNSMLAFTLSRGGRRQLAIPTTAEERNAFIDLARTNYPDVVKQDLARAYSQVIPARNKLLGGSMFNPSTPTDLDSYLSDILENV